MPLTNSQINKLNTIPNRVKIYGQFSKELNDLKKKYEPMKLRDFVLENESTIKKMPLSSIRNDMNFASNAPRPSDFLSSYELQRKTTICDITPDRVVAGYVTSGTGVLTDKYATDTEVIFIEDETGGIGVIIENSLERNYQLETGNSFPNMSLGTANSKPVSNGAHQIGGNIPANDYRHNIRIGDLLIIYGGKYRLGTGYAYDNPTVEGGGNRWPNQGISVIEQVTDYMIDSEFRGVSPRSYGLFPGETSPIHTKLAQFGWQTNLADNRLMTLRGRFRFVRDPYGGTLTPLFGNNLIFLPNRVYYLEMDDQNASRHAMRRYNTIGVVISQTTELARFGVKIPTQPFSQITGIICQDTESDQRFIYPRFFSDIYSYEPAK